MPLACLPPRTPALAPAQAPSPARSRSAQPMKAMGRNRLIPIFRDHVMTTASRPALDKISFSGVTIALISHCLRRWRSRDSGSGVRLRLGRPRLFAGPAGGAPGRAHAPLAPLQTGAPRPLACGPARGRVVAAAHHRDDQPLVGRLRGLTVTDGDTCVAAARARESLHRAATRSPPPGMPPWLCCARTDCCRTPPSRGLVQPAAAAGCQPRGRQSARAAGGCVHQPGARAAPAALPAPAGGGSGAGRQIVGGNRRPGSIWRPARR